MSILPERKKQLVREFRTNDTDTGSPEVQIAVLTERIRNLTEHFKTHVKDNNSRRGLLMLVSRRKHLLGYLRGCDEQRYRNTIQRLNLRH